MKNISFCLNRERKNEDGSFGLLLMTSQYFKHFLIILETMTTMQSTSHVTIVIQKGIRTFEGPSTKFCNRL